MPGLPTGCWPVRPGPSVWPMKKWIAIFPADQIVITGNPVRQSFAGSRGIKPDEACRNSKLEEGKKVCLVVGGSLGARTLNQSIMEGLEKLDREDLQVLWQCGKYYQEEVEEQVRAQRAEKHPGHCHLFPEWTWPMEWPM